MTDDGLTRNQRYEFRLMARYPEIVEAVIAESTDEDPPTRRKVLRAIREHQGRTSEPPGRIIKKLEGVLSEAVAAGLLDSELAAEFMAHIRAESHRRLSPGDKL